MVVISHLFLFGKKFQVSQRPIQVTESFLDGDYSICFLDKYDIIEYAPAGGDYIIFTNE